MSEPTTRTLTVDGVELSFTEQGDGPHVLVLHGGGGPSTVTGWAGDLATDWPAHVLTPVHPGFAATPRLDGLESITGLARLYTALLDQLELTDVTVIGNSIGGWIAAEMAVLGSQRVGHYVLVDAVGIEVAGHPVVDFFSLSFDEIAQRSYHDPQRFGIDPATLPPAAREVMTGNRAALAVYGGRTMTDPTLVGRLAGVSTPTLVVWGDSDRIGDPDFGRAYAAAIPGARFELLRDTGHLPQLESPAALTSAVQAFVET